MDKNRWGRQEFKALGSHNITINTEFLNDSYNMPLYTSAVPVGQTGLLELLRIEPKRTDLPSFRVRWDQNEDSVNVDLIGDSEETRKFAQQRAGYIGHKTDRVNASPRTQAIDIQTPSTGRIFKGTMALNIDLGLVLRDGFAVSADIHMDAIVIRKTEGGLTSRVMGKLKAYSSIVYSFLKSRRWW
jgi:hypothetical protein